ncbi:ABC transporter ATP-binding protein (plasmid) [Rhodococcus globerulus]|uniref:ABC transporter ATP-binding protein n=1 Tax=Rhodococcus globerulus TaxID=33008 RepID=UPI0039EBFB6D
MNTPVVTMSGVSIGPTGGEAPTLHEIDLVVLPGQVLGITGGSGSGKTTLALSLVGQMRRGLEARAGTIRVLGIDPLTDAGARELRGRRITYLGQDPAASLNPGRRLRSALAELIRLRSALRPTRTQVRDEITRLMKLVQLPDNPDFLRRFPHQISGGQAQRVAMAQAMAGNPELLILDEPTSALDPMLALEIREVLRRIIRTCSVVLVSHDLQLLADLADSTLLLAGGRVLGEYPAAELPRTPRPATLAPATFVRSEQRAALEIRGLTALHGRRAALTDVSLTLASGECLAVVGPSGSGKSTLARCLVGLHRKSTGTVLLNGRSIPLTSRERNRADRGAVALVAQNSAGALNPAETVGDALARPLRSQAGLSATAVKIRVAELLDSVCLPEYFAERYPAKLSGGERQRINLARALAAEPRILVCDEVTSALDAENAAAVMELLAGLRRNLGVAVVLVTHDLSVALRSADRIAVMADGRIVEHGSSTSILSAPTDILTRSLVHAAGVHLL